MRAHSHTSISWDETQQELSLGIDTRLKGNRDTCAWQVMVSMSEFLLTVVPPNGTTRSNSLFVARPPIALSNTSALAQYHGLYRTPIGMNVDEVCRSMHHTTTLGTNNVARDGASTADKLVTNVARETTDCVSDHVCGMHMETGAGRNGIRIQ